MHVISRARRWPHAPVLATDRFGAGLVRWFLLALVTLAVSAVLFWVFEQGKSEEIHSVFSGFHWVWRTLLEQSSPWHIHSFAAEIVYFVVLVAGVGVVATGTGAIASKLMEVVMRRAQGMSDTNVKSHVLICGWNAKGHEVITELHADEVQDPPHVVILANLDMAPVRGRRVQFLRGDPSRREDLLRAGACDARTVLILADESAGPRAPEDIDAKTLLTALAVESLDGGSAYTVAEVIRSDDRRHFDHANVNELIVSGEVTGALLASAATSHGLSRVVEDLLGHEQGNELYRAPVPHVLVGKGFSDAISILKHEYSCIPIAIAESDERYVVNPPGDRVLTGEDELLVIAEKEPDW